MLSAYLPENFDPRRPVVLIAGQSRYPLLIAQAIIQAGLELRLVAFEEETAAELIALIPPVHRTLIKVGQLGHMLKALQKFDAGYAIMAGQITPRRLFKGLHPDLKATRILFSLKRRNAETIFGAIATEIEKIGVTLLDARSFLDDQLASFGSITGSKFPIEPEYLDHGIHLAKECARLDIGQGCVVRNGTVLAVEAFEGTDAMITRAGEFKTENALFVKTVKHAQDYRFDVPCFGLKTLESMQNANITAAALEVDRVIMIDKAQVVARAREAKISLWGFTYPA
jgi:UDP-2,3-diacylglucosamine hydrolase